jgi:hypothetical protein
LHAVVVLAPEPATTEVGCTQCAATEYSVTDLGIPRGGRFGQAAGINAREDIVGSSSSKKAFGGTIGLLAFSTSARAECAWVLWQEQQIASINLAEPTNPCR